MIKKIIYNLITFLITIISVCFLTIIRPETLNKTWFLILLISPQVLWLLTYIFGWLNLKVLKKLSISLLYIMCFCIIGYIILYKLNILYMFSSVSSLKNYIISTGSKGVLIYILIQMLQVVFLPIPASIICIVGSIIYGPWFGALYCSIGVLLGSIISFFIGRIFGYKLVSWIVGEDNTIKYSEIIRTKGIFFLGLAFLLPMFPDDILCFIAGITRLSTKKFLLITILTRPIGVIFMAIFGGGHIIPFSGWGLYAWAIILVVAIAFVIIIMKWQDKIQDFLMKKLLRRNIGNSNTQKSKI